MRWQLEWKAAADVRKPNSVRLRSAPFGAELRRDDHSSSPIIADGIEQPTRRRRTGRPLAPPCGRTSPPYLALLRAGFCLPPVLPRARCALTAPFHHCPPYGVGCVFSVPLSFGLPRPGVTRRTALRSSDFPPLDSRRAAIVWTSAAVQSILSQFVGSRGSTGSRGARGSGSRVPQVPVVPEVRFTGPREPEPWEP